MFAHELTETMDTLVCQGKGILAADESTSTIGKRFNAIGLENTELNRRNYRLLLATTPDLAKYINGVILFEETFTQKDDNGTPIAQLFAEQGIVPGIKVDKGLVPMAFTDEEQITQGLDGLTERLHHYKNLGARFAKWRNVYRISDNTPSFTMIKAGAANLARYAACCQEAGIVPIVEPEILIDGAHSIDECADVSELVLHEVFDALFTHQVELESIILKPSMVTSGQAYQPFSDADEIAAYTLHVFRNHVPAAVPSINFLSGGQTCEAATAHLQAINSQDSQPWNLSFSFGRALQETCIKAWGGQEANIEQAQQALLKRARLNSLAATGEYHPDLEHA